MAVSLGRIALNAWTLPRLARPLRPGQGNLPASPGGLRNRFPGPSGVHSRGPQPPVLVSSLISAGREPARELRVRQPARCGRAWITGSRVLPRGRAPCCMQPCQCADRADPSRYDSAAAS